MSLIFVIAVITVGWLLYQQYFKTLMNQGQAGQIKLAMIVLGLIFLAMAVTGRAPALFAILGALMTQAMRFGPLLVRFMPSLKKAYNQSSGNAGKSQVATNTLKMTLDHASGAMDGEVLAGNLSGRQLQTLSLEELKDLYSYCQQNDAEACRLLMSFISRERADSWDGESQAGGGSESGQSSGSHAAGGSAAMDKSEAMALLGLEEPFNKQDITQAHRSLMGKFHPDKGGNTYLATKLNKARDLLLEDVMQA